MSREAGYHKLFQTHLWLWGLHARIFCNEIASSKHSGDAVSTQREELPFLVAVCRWSTCLAGAAFQDHGHIFYPIRSEERNLRKLQNELHIFTNNDFLLTVRFLELFLKRIKDGCSQEGENVFPLKNGSFLNRFDFAQEFKTVPSV